MSSRAARTVPSLALDRDLLARVRSRLAEAPAPPTAAAVAAALRQEAGAWRGDAQLLAVLGAVQSEITGAGPLEPLLADPAVTDVLVNAPDEVWVDRGDGLELTEVRFPDDAAVRALAQRLVAGTGRRLDDAQPWVDARLADGTRLHAVLRPVATRATCLSLRTTRRRPFTLPELVAAGTVHAGAVELLRGVVCARLPFLVTGGTGTGKTTLLTALLGLVDPAERIVLVEDAGELRPDHRHVVRLEARPPNIEGSGVITLRDLVRQALRMRPDRLVVGEVRGAEVADLLAALNTGHDGGCGTLHANGAREVPARLEALGAVAGLPRAALHSQLAAALQVVLHLERGRDGVRRLAELCVLDRGTDGLVVALPAWIYRDGELRPGPSVERLDALVSRSGIGSGREPSL